LGDQRVVGFREAREIASVRKIDFVGAIEHADLGGDGAVFAERYAATFWRALKGR